VPEKRSRAAGRRAPRPSASELAVGLDVARFDELEGAEDLDEVGARERLELLEERRPLAGVVEPVFPARVEGLLDGFGQAPQRDAARGLEDLGAAVRGDREHRARLREAVRAREAAPERGRTEASELALGVPPLREVHLAEARDDEAQLEQAVEIDATARRPKSTFSVRVCER
jgi:hypothetical protein